MSEKIKLIIRRSVEDLIQASVSDEKLKESYANHKDKIHFIPPKYRVLGGILHSLNIKFGNFIEKLLDKIVENDSQVIAHPLSGKKVWLNYTEQSDSCIDQYITRRQSPNSLDDCGPEFSVLLKNIKRFESDKGLEKIRIKKDIDSLFYTKNNFPIYTEVKYNDDHDTGKFEQINRKFLKTYACLLNQSDINNRSELVPYIYYFNPSKRWGPIYTPSTNIKRGAQLFDDYFETSFADVDRYLREIGDDPEILKIFDELYSNIRNKL
jgi:hypothetical protein